MPKNRSRKQSVLKLLVSLGLIAPPILVLSTVVEAMPSTYTTEQAMIDAGGVNPTLTDAYNRAERILPAPIGELNTRGDLIAHAEEYYAQRGFDRNLLTWGDISPIPLSDPWFDSDPEWASCTKIVTENGAQVSTPNRDVQFVNVNTYTNVPCPDADPQRFSPIERSIGSGSVTLLRQGDTYIGMACGNFSPDAEEGLYPTISGAKYNDLDADGVRDANEPGIAGWPISVIYNGAVIWSGTTEAGGTFRVDLDANIDDRLAAGVYTIVEAARTAEGWQQSTGLTRTVNVRTDDGVWNYQVDAFGNFQVASIAGQKFEDVLADGPDVDDPGLAGWEIIAESDAGVFTTVTGSDGSYEIDGLVPGTYTVSETPQADWEQSYPASSTYTITLAPNDEITGVDFGNFQRGAIEGDKFHDLEVDGVYDATDPGVSDWQITVNGPEGAVAAVTGVDGSYEVDGLRPGVYQVAEAGVDGWVQSYPSERDYSVTVRSGETITDIDFGNVCLGNIEVNLNDVTGGPEVDDFDIRVEEVDVPGVLDNEAVFPIEQTGGTITGLLPGTYQVTVFLPDATFSPDDVVVVDGRFAVVKTITVENCETSTLSVDTLTASSGKVTGGILEDIDGVRSTAGFNVKTTRDGGVQGVVQFVEHAQGGGLNLHTDMIDGIVVAEPDAWVWGEVLVDSELVRFGLHLVDTAEPGRQDRFELLLATGYDSGFGFTLTGGNVQLHVEK